MSILIKGMEMPTSCHPSRGGRVMNDTTFQGNGKITYVPVVVNAKPPKQTNADRIRAMTDEELAEWIRDQIIDRNIGIPTETWLDWLKQEVSE